MRPTHWLVTAAVVTSAAFAIAVGCDITVVANFPEDRGWGPSEFGEGGEGGTGIPTTTTDTLTTTTGAGGTGGALPYPEFCATCHGTVGNPAPPPDMDRNTDTTVMTVGAHQAHFKESAWHLHVGCNQCHLVPVTATYDPNVPTHLNDENDINWGAIAQSGTFDAVTGTCTGSYCHGATMAPDIEGVTTIREPVWNLVDGSQMICGQACHSLPPNDAEHEQQPDGPLPTACAAPDAGCHSAVFSTYDELDPAAAVWANPDLHIDGVVNSDVP